MTPDEHQRERMRAWVRFYDGAEYADIVLAEFDKRFPAPSAAAPVEPVVDRYVIGYSDGAEAVMQGMPTTSELASLRQKARLWDAVASGKVRLSVAGRAYCTWDLGNEMTSLCDTAEEAVEAAIAAGALK